MLKGEQLRQEYELVILQYDRIVSDDDGARLS